MTDEELRIRANDGIATPTPPAEPPDAVANAVDREMALRAERDALREALTLIHQKYEFRSELFTNDEDCAGNLADVARAALVRAKETK